MKMLNVSVTCRAHYDSKIEVPDNYSLKDAIKFAKENVDALNIGDLEWDEDIEVDDEYCNFDK